ncbi:MAG: hypothetical protein M1825_002081 [Sarcosagium campestre]|nr:MAG: hypothetical protein M1825_002081 [Sarcosagium campestre]
MDDLLEALQARHIPLGRDDVQWAFETPSAADQVLPWVQKYLGPETLLSMEELQLYSKLETLGAATAFSKATDLATIRPILDGELQTAILALNQSTAAIDQHAALLKSQRNALSAIKSSQQEAETARERALARRSKRRAQEEQRLSISIEDMVQNLTVQLSTCHHQLKAREQTLNTIVQESLLADDKLLSRLETLINESLNSYDSCQQKNVEAEHVKNLCSQLATFKVDEIRSRLDLVFLEGHAGNQLAPDVSRGVDELSTLTTQTVEELDSLCTELDDVARMSVTQQYLQPNLRIIQGQRSKTTENAEWRILYAIQTLEYLGKRLESLTDRAACLRSHRFVMQSLTDSLNSQIDQLAAVVDSPSKRSKSPARNPMSSPGSRSPARKHRDSTTLTEHENGAALELLRNLGSTFPAEESPFHNAVRKIASTILDHNGKLRSLLTSLESSTDKSLVEHLGSAELSLRLLVETVYSESKFSDSHLLDEDLEKSLLNLDYRVGQVGKGLATLDLDGLSAPDKERDRFIERWSGRG